MQGVGSLVTPLSSLTSINTTHTHTHTHTHIHQFTHPKLHSMLQSQTIGLTLDWTVKEPSHFHIVCAYILNDSNPFILLKWLWPFSLKLTLIAYIYDQGKIFIGTYS